MYQYHQPFDYFPGFPLIHDTSSQPQQVNADFNITFLPNLGQQSFWFLIKQIHKAIVDEATAINFYSRLLNETPYELDKEFITHAYEDEQKHLHAFTKLYVHFTGQQPQYQIEPIEYPNYKEGLLLALKNELEAAEFYRDVQMSSTDPLVRDTFFYAMMDEVEHETQFAVLYHSI